MRKSMPHLYLGMVVCVWLLAGLWGCQKSGELEKYDWVTIDQYYQPQNYVEAFIKNYSAKKGLLPLKMKNYDQNTSILRQFRGKNFANPTESQLNMMYKGLQDWMLIDLKYTAENNQEVLRTILYVKLDDEWEVGDSGQLTKR